VYFYISDIAKDLGVTRDAFDEFAKRHKKTAADYGFTSQKRGLHSHRTAANRKWLAFVEDLSSEKKDIVISIILEKLQSGELDEHRAYALIKAVQLGEVTREILDKRISRELGINDVLTGFILMGRSVSVEGTSGVYSIISMAILDFFHRTGGYKEIVKKYGDHVNLAKKIDLDKKAKEHLGSFLFTMAKSRAESLPPLQIKRRTTKGKQLPIQLTKDEKLKLIEAKFLRQYPTFVELTSHLSKILGIEGEVEVAPETINRFFKGSSENNYFVEGAIHVLRRYFEEHQELYRALVDSGDVPTSLVPDSYRKHLVLMRELNSEEVAARKKIARLKLTAGK